jgi:ADP-L-glycero-D-manno-heptose 6-epimerase
MTGSVILLTGGAGFIGSNIAARLAEDPDLEVVVCDRLRAADSGKWRNLSKHAIADFIAPEALFDWLEHRADAIGAVIHMGAISSTSEADADKIIHTNFSLSRDLFQWCALNGRRMIYASSAATYGDGAQGFSDLDDPTSLAALRPLNAYGWSKSLFDLYAARAAGRGNAPPQWVGLKFFNVYGPNEAHKGAMKSVAAQIWPQARQGETVHLFKSYRNDYADGGQLRDFVYVRDIVDVVSWLLRTERVSGIFNLGSGEARSFYDLAQIVFRAAGQPSKIEYNDMPEHMRDKYQYFTKAEMSRLHKSGYDRPMTSLEDGIGDYIQTYLSTNDCYR